MDSDAISSNLSQESNEISLWDVSKFWEYAAITLTLMHVEASLSDTAAVEPTTSKLE